MSTTAPPSTTSLLVGHLASDPILRPLDQNRRVCDVRHAVNDRADKQPLFIDARDVRFKRRGLRRVSDLSQGRALAIAIAGRLISCEWLADDGTRWSKHIVVGRVQFGGRHNGDQPRTAASRPATSRTPSALIGSGG